MNKILNFGSLNIDEVLSVPHFVNPGETLGTTAYQRFCGGKGLNQSIALAKAGASVFHAGSIGKDGSFLIDMLQKADVDTSFVRITSEPSGRAVIQVAPNGQNAILLLHGANYKIQEEQINQTLAAFSQGDWLLIQNEINNIHLLMQKAYEKGMKIAFNPSPFDASVSSLPLHLVTCFIVNEIEGTSLTGTSDVKEAMNEMRKRFPSARIILTLGENGSMFSDKNTMFFTPAKHVTAVDTTGAGDTFTGFYLASILAQKSDKTALELATRASAIAVTRNGAASSIPSMEEVLAI